MKKCFVLLFSCISISVCAQVGRYEEPVDTIPIGGQIQENKTTQMEAQDQLVADLIAVRDSLHFLPAESGALSRKKELDQIVQGLRARDQAPELMKRGFVLLTEVRTELRNSLKPASAEPRKSFRK